MITKKDLIIGIVAVLVTMTLASFISPYIYLVGIVLMLGYYFYRVKFGTKPEVPQEEETIKKDGIDMDWQSEVSSKDAYTYLMHANHKLRVESQSLRMEDVTVIEALIDDLRNLVLMVEDSSSVLKWKVNQICVDFVPKLINRFNAASNEDRTEIMATTVHDIRSKLAEIETVVNNNNKQEFEHYATTLQKIMKA